MSDHVDVRASFQRFPRWTQHFWTWFTGRALPGQEPLVRFTWWSYLAMVLIAFFAGLCLSTLAIAYPSLWQTTRWPLSRAPVPLWWIALALGWTLTIWSSRVMILVIAHQCIHKQFTRSSRLDAFVGELVTVLTLFQDAAAFKEEHFDAHHQPEIFASETDPPVQVIMGLGFRPGMSKARLWHRAWWVFLTPALYMRGFWSRLRCNLLSGTWRRVGFFVWCAWWLALPFWLASGIWALLFAFVLPIVPVAQLSALLDKLGEHAWLTPPDPRHSRRHHHVAASWARFCGSPVPAASLPLRKQLIAWPLWIAEMLLYHLPSRLFVVVGDLPNHDFHHRYPGTRDWMVAAYARQRDIDDGAEPAYTEVWGMGAAIDRMFDSLAHARPATRVDGAAQEVSVIGLESHSHAGMDRRHLS